MRANHIAWRHKAAFVLPRMGKLLHGTVLLGTDERGLVPFVEAGR